MPSIRFRSLFFRIVLLSLPTAAAMAPQANAMTHHVTRTADDESSGSLRYEVENAVDGDSIDFQLVGCPCVINVLTPPIKVSASISIEGSGMSSLLLDGSQSFQSILVSDAKSFTVASLTVQNASDTAVIVSSGTSYFSNVAFIGNSWGAISIEKGIVEISNSLFEDNISLDESATTETIFQNPCDGCSLLVANSSFIGNKAAQCSAILSQSTTVIENDTFVNNTSLPSGGFPTDISGDGGAICFGNGGEIRSSTFVNNKASSEGGAMSIFGYSSKPVVIANSVFASNRALSGPNISGQITSWGHNLVSDRSGSFGYQKTCDPLASGLFPGDLPEQEPKVAPPHISKASGLPIVTPNPGSPLIDAISIGAGHCDGIDLPKTDARGVHRPQGAAADIGAIEFVPDDDRIFCNGVEGSACVALH
jgi:hypothetical protein